MKKIKSVICFLNGLWLTIQNIPWVTGHDFVELGRRACDPRYMKTLECKRCGHMSVGWSVKDRRIELGLNNLKCPQCGYPYPPDPPPLHLIAGDGREFRKDGWGVQRDQNGRPEHPWYSAGNFAILLIVVTGIASIFLLGWMLVSVLFPKIPTP